MGYSAEKTCWHPTTHRRWELCMTIMACLGVPCFTAYSCLTLVIYVKLYVGINVLICQQVTLLYGRRTTSSGWRYYFWLKTNCLQCLSLKFSMAHVINHTWDLCERGILPLCMTENVYADWSVCCRLVTFEQSCVEVCHVQHKS